MKKKSKHLADILFAISILFVLAAAAFFLRDEIGFFNKTVGQTSVGTETSSANTSLPTTFPTVGVIVEPTAEPYLMSEPTAEPTTIPTPEPTPMLLENPYKDKFLENPDMVAWIKIPDTSVDNPVMWTPNDEQYYLYRNFDGKKGKGLPLLDTDTWLYPEPSANIIIHGHNYFNEPPFQFSDLLNYEDKAYCDEHPYIYLYGKDYEHVYEIMAVFRSRVFYEDETCFKYYFFFDAQNAEEFDYYFTNVKALALYDTGVSASFGDTLITLSTCSPHEENGRFVVVGKETEHGNEYLSVTDK